MNRLGIIGGVGPLAAAHFYQRVIQLTPADGDDAHLPVVLDSEPIPSRIAHLQGRGPTPAPALVRVARTLVRAGADTLAIPSATTHAYRSDIMAAVDVPVLDLLQETATYLAESHLTRPVVLATAPTAALRFYEPKLAPGARARYPAPSAQREVDRLIDAVKRAAPLPPLTTRLTDLITRCPWSPDSDCVVLGCTELSVINPGPLLAGLPVVDVTDILAEAVLRHWTPETSRDPHYAGATS